MKISTSPYVDPESQVRFDQDLASLVITVVKCKVSSCTSNRWAELCEPECGCTVHQGLPRMDLLGESDPYVKIFLLPNYRKVNKKKKVGNIKVHLPKLNSIWSNPSHDFTTILAPSS